MGLASSAGLSCVGIAIWSISNMRHPYINQWTDLTKDKFNPIVSRANTDTIRQTLGLGPKTEITDKIIENFYLVKLTKTPEIFVEDFLNSTVNDDSFQLCTVDIVRISDVKLKVDEDDKNVYRLSFVWDQTIEFPDHKAQWSVNLKNLKLELNKNTKNGWSGTFNLDEDSKWTGKWTFKNLVGFDGLYPNWWKNPDFNNELNKDTYRKTIMDDFFYFNNYLSWFLSELN